MKHHRLSIALWALLFTCFALAHAAAEQLTLPASLTRIESQAFAGVHVDSILFPPDIAYIADDAFDGASFMGRGLLGSYAHHWCVDHGFPFEEDITGSSLIDLAKVAEGFEFSGLTGSEANPEERMAHNIYANPNLAGTTQKFCIFSIDFMTENAPTDTYWALCNWEMDVTSFANVFNVTDPGMCYAGLQMTDDGPKAIIAFWEIHYEDESGNDAILNAKLVYPEEDAGRFDGEGEGTHYLAPYDWQANHWYRMLIMSYDGQNGNTWVDQWLLDMESGVWTLFCTYDTCLQNSYFKGEMSQFMENFWSDSCNEFRSCRFTNYWVMEEDTREWKPLTGITMSTDTWWDNKKGYYAFGSDGTSVWGVTCGYGPDVVQTTPGLTTSSYHTLPQGIQPIEKD